MADKVKLSKDGSSIDFVQSESIPTSVKKFRQSPEIEGFYRFIFENDLQKEAYEILERIVNSRKAKKKSDKLEAAQPAPKKNEPAKKVATPAKAEPISKKTVIAKKVDAKEVKNDVKKKPILKKAAPAKPAPVKTSAKKAGPAKKAPSKKR